MSNITPHFEPKTRVNGLASYAQGEKVEKRWCKKHPVSYWGKKKDGTWFNQCATGYKYKEECIRGE